MGRRHPSRNPQGALLSRSALVALSGELCRLGNLCASFPKASRRRWFFTTRMPNPSEPAGRSERDARFKEVATYAVVARRLTCQAPSAL